MPEAKPIPITPAPGVIKTEAARVVQGRWSHTEKVRFVRGRPQKLGGYAKQNADATSGIPRALYAWRDLAQSPYIAAGTFSKLYVFPQDISRNDITPLRDSGTLTDPFATTEDSSIVVVTDTAHACRPGDTVFYSGADAVGGLDLNGSHVVLTVPGTGSYTIDAGEAATSTVASGGGSVDFEYEINVGTEYAVPGLGFGVGRYGIDTYGDPHEGSTLIIEPRFWSLDNFGQILLAAYNGGSLYEWDPSDPGIERAELVSDAPTDIRFMFITPERIVIALCDDMRIDWCDQNDYLNWTPAEDNTARAGRKVGVGTKLIGGKVLAQFVSAIWTDAALYLHRYTGSQLVFDTELVARNSGLIAPSAAVVVDGIAYWMSQNTFLQYAGSVQEMPNVADIKRYVFDNLRTERAFQCCAAYVAKFNEVWYFYVGVGQADPGLLVIFHRDDQVWSVGTLERVSATHFQDGDTRPYMGGPDGFIYLHEEGYNADGAVMNAEIVLAPSGLENGHQLLELDGFEADFHEQAGDIEVQFDGWDRLRDAATLDTQTKTIGETESLTDLRICARYLGMTIRSETLDGYFRVGAPQVFAQGAGTRR